MKLLHLKIFLGVWLFVMIAAMLISRSLLVEWLYTPRVFSSATLIWIAACFTAFWGGTFIERCLYSRGHSRNNITLPIVPLNRLIASIRTFKGFFSIVSLVILGRFLWCVKQVGSLSGTLVAATTNPTDFKFDLWQQASFHGIGALSDIILACTIFAFALYGLVKKYKTQPSEVSEYGFDDKILAKLLRSSRRLLLASLMVLLTYFVLSNERIAFVAGFLGGILAYFLIIRSFPVKKLIYLGVFLLLVWVLVEGSRRSYFGTESWGFIMDYAKDRLLLYLVAGLRNVDTVVNYLPNHTLGWYTFGFVFSSLNLDFLGSISDTLYGFGAYTIVPGFGVIPVFGTAYADFGVAALGYFMLLGFAYQKIDRKALEQGNFLMIQIYGFLLVALLISFVAFLPIIARFWINLLVLFLINKGIRSGLTPLRLKLARS